jgi:hypothetical protein
MPYKDHCIKRGNEYVFLCPFCGMYESVDKMFMLDEFTPICADCLELNIRQD